MSASAKITDERVLGVRFEEHRLTVDLMDDRGIFVPFA
jgi:hypothetical protein